MTREEAQKLIAELKRKQGESEEELRKLRDRIERLQQMLQRKPGGSAKKQAE